MYSTKWQVSMIIYFDATSDFALFGSLSLSAFILSFAPKCTAVVLTSTLQRTAQSKSRELGTLLLTMLPQRAKVGYGAVRLDKM